MVHLLTVKLDWFMAKSRFKVFPFDKLLFIISLLYHYIWPINLLKESVSIDVDNGSNQGIISAGDNLVETNTVADTLLEAESAISSAETDEGSSSKEKIIISSVVASCAIILIVIYIFLIRPRLQKKSKTKPQDNKLSRNPWNQQPSEHILRNL